MRVYSWSDTDLWQLHNECWLKGLDVPQSMGRWMDFQRVFGRLVGFNTPISLKKAVDYANIRFDGAAHTALGDAVATSELLRTVVLEKGFAEKCHSVRQEFSSKLQGSTIGNLIGT